MQLHIDVLGWLHLVWGIFGVLTGTSLGVLALGTNAAVLDLGPMGPAEQAAVWVFLLCGGLLAGAGVAMIVVGRGLAQRRRAARVAALLLALPNLIVVPFGTALGIYVFWVLLNDDARREFGRPPRSPVRMRPMEGA